MIYELEIFHTKRRGQKPVYLWLKKPTYSVGRGLENDILLLSPEIERNAGTVHVTPTRIEWKGAGREEKMDLKLGPALVGPFRISARLSSHFKLFVSAVLLILAFFIFLKVQTSNQSETPLSTQEIGNVIQSIHLPAKGKYGKFSSEEPGNRILRFEFVSDQSSNYDLHYSAGNIEHSDTLAIYLNGQFLNYVPASLGRWSQENRETLSKEIMRKGSNQIEFRYEVEDPQERLWGIRDVYVVKTHREVQNYSPEIFYEASRKLFDQRNAKPGYLAQAEEMIMRAKAAYRQSGKPLPKEALYLEDEIGREIQNLLESKRVEFLNEKRLGRLAEARSVIQNTLAEFSRQTDPRRDQILQWIHATEK